jgi:hypothetical protein
MHDDDVPIERWLITGADRCDVCRAHAYAWVRTPSTGDYLFFCAHHWAKHKPALIAQYGAWGDETARLYEDEAARHVYSDPPEVIKAKK